MIIINKMDIDYTLHNFIGNLVSSRANKGLVILTGLL